MKALLRFVVPIVIAVALGPLIAGIAVWVFAVGHELFETSGLTFKDWSVMLGVYVIFAYVIGGAIALLAGILVSIWMVWRAPSLIVVIAAALIATAAYLGAGSQGWLGPVEFTNARSNYLTIGVLATLSAAGCWLLTRRFARSA